MKPTKKNTFGAPSNFDVKKFEHDHFFSSVAEGLNSIRKKFKFNSKQLRLKCKIFLLGQMEDVSSKSRAEALLSKRTKFNTIEEYCLNIENADEECKILGKEVPILGQPDVEGRILSELFNIQIHLVEYIDCQWKHYLINKDGVEQVDSHNISYKNKDLIHLVKIEENNFTAAVQTDTGTQGVPNSDKKIGGVIDWGRLYEEGILAHIAIQCALNREVEDFELYSNMSGVGAFDDVVLKIKYAGEKEAELYLLQLKHKEDNNVNISTIFENKGGIFYMPKYQRSFDEIREKCTNNSGLKIFDNIKLENIHLILFSNIKLEDNKDNVSTNTYLFSKEVNCCNIMKTFNTKENVFPYKISMKNQSNENNISCDFLEKCWVYFNQLNANEIEKLLETDLENNIRPDKVKLVLDHFAKWTRQKRNDKISKSDMVNIILEHCLPHYDVLIPKNVNVKNYDLILDTFNDNCFFPFLKNKPNLETLKCSIINRMESYVGCEINTDLWFKEIDCKFVRNDLVQKRKQFTSRIRYSDLYYLLWQMKKLPMLIEFSEENVKCIQFMLEKFENYLSSKSFILIYKEFPPSIIHTEKLNRVIKLDMLDQILISLQGKSPINLQDLAKNNQKVLQSITPDVLITLLTNTTMIGAKCELIPYYVSRKIKFPVLIETIFDKVDDLFILNDSKRVSIEEYVKEYEQTITRQQEIKSFTFKYQKVNVLHSELSAEDSFKVLETIENKFKHFLIKDGGCFRLLKSDGVLNLKTHLKRRNFILVKEDNVLEYVKSPVNIVCNTAGMGKTCLLQSISRNAAPEEWTIYLNLNEHVHSLDLFDYSKEEEEVIKYLLESQTKFVCNSFNNFVKELLLANAKNGNLILILDGYDEVIFKNLHQFARWALEMNTKIFISTRPSKVDELENSLGIFSLEIEHFDRKDSVEFLKQFYEESNTAQLIEKVKFLDESFVGIPLQTKLLAEVFGDMSEERYKFDLVYLYEQFFDKKIRELPKHKQASYKTFYKKMSLKLFFTEELLEFCNINLIELNERAEEFKGENKKDFIISGFTSKDTPMFVHRTYAEFLAAQYLYEQLLNDKFRNKEKLHEKLFYIEMTDVRYFLDRIASKNYELHTAVLNNDIKLVRQLLERENLSEVKDELGRTALELACSYGKRFDLDTEEDISGLINLEKHIQIELVHWNEWCKGNQIQAPILEQKFVVKLEIFKLLLNNSHIAVPANYLLKTGSLEMLNCFPNVYQINELPQRKLELLCYHCTVHNFFNIVNNICDDKLFNNYYNRELLTHIAASYGNFEVCTVLCKKGAETVHSKNGRKLLHVAAYNGQVGFMEKALEELDENIDEITNKDGLTPLHFAVSKSHFNVVDFLLLNGADTNITSTWGRQHVLHTACTSNRLGCIKIVERLLEHDKIDLNFLNIRDNIGFTPLHYAFYRGDLNLMNVLLSNGADINVKTLHGEHLLHLICTSLHNVGGGTHQTFIVFWNSSDTINLLPLLKGANLNIKTNRREHFCSEDCKILKNLQHKIITAQDINGNVINLLFLNEANINLENKLLLSNPFNVKIAASLLELYQNDQFRNSYINAQDSDGRTPLYWAVHWTNALPINDGTDVNCINLQNNHERTIKGGDVDVTAMQLAVEQRINHPIATVEKILQVNDKLKYL